VPILDFGFWILDFGFWIGEEPEEIMDRVTSSGG